MDGDEWTERGAGDPHGAGVVVEQQALGWEQHPGKARGGIWGDRELWDPCDGRRDGGGLRDSSARRGKSCRSRTSYLFSSWMSWWLGGVQEKRLPLLMWAPTRDQCPWWDGAELTRALDLAPSWTQDLSRMMTGGGADSAARQAVVASVSRAQVVSVCAGLKVSMNFSASWIW